VQPEQQLAVQPSQSVQPTQQLVVQPLQCDADLEAAGGYLGEFTQHQCDYCAKLPRNNYEGFIGFSVE
jgi:hypothetical protein